MTKVKRITVSNLKAVSSLTADFNGCTAIITGGNNKGKTSFLRSLPDRLRGNKNEYILKHGEKEGSAEWELTTGEKFIWTFAEGKEKLTYISEKNIPASVTKDISTRYFPPVFDVDRFLNDTPKEQKKTLQKLSGIDFTEIEKLYKDAYEQRTYLNRKRDEAKAKLVFFDPKMPADLLPTDELEKEINSIEAHNLKYKNVEDGVNSRRQQIAQKQQSIQQLQEQIIKLTHESDELIAECYKGDEWMKDVKNQPKMNKAELEKQLSEVNEKNNGIIENNNARKLQEEYDAAIVNANEADAEVKRIEGVKNETIRMANLPDGFGFTEDGITYNDFPFTRDCLSSSGIYIGALKLASTQLGEVKALYFDASYLDKNSLAEIEQWANNEGLQLFIERPDFDGGEIHYELVTNNL